MVTKPTVDGWVAEASLVNVVVNTVPNLARSPWTREAFVDATAIGNITGRGSTGGVRSPRFRCRSGCSRVRSARRI
ncbi:MspA family porin [Nocardia otitidiscaviarum]|nr:MspA family porin [Nocardia otitidiscaviarum]